MDDRPDSRSYVIYAPTPWVGSRQLTHNLAEALAAAHPVLYVDPPLSPLGPLRYGLSSSTLPRLRALAARRLHDAGGVQLFTPLSLPPVRHPRMRRLSIPFVRSQIERTVRSAGFRRPIVLGAHWFPEMNGAAGESLRVGMVMDHPTAGAALMGLDPDEVSAEKAALYRGSDFVLTTSQALSDLLAADGLASELIPAGLPIHMVDAFDSVAEPRDYEGLPRPLLGYTGSIDDRLDFELIVALADEFRDGSIVFVGSVNPRLSAQGRAALAMRPNIHVLGARDQEQLPGYISALDVALLPYLDSDFTRYQSPIKVWEYLYAGPPIVGTGSVALRAYAPPLVNYAERRDEVAALVRRALVDPDVGRDARRRFALANSFAARATQLDDAVTRHLNSERTRHPGELAAVPTCEEPTLSSRR